jgi:aspartate/glutamate racemase
MADLVESLPLVEDSLKVEEYSKLVPLLSKPAHSKRLLLHALLFFVLSLESTDHILLSFLPQNTNPYLLTAIKTAVFITLVHIIDSTNKR